MPDGAAAESGAEERKASGTNVREGTEAREKFPPLAGDGLASPGQLVRSGEPVVRPTRRSRLLES